MDKKIKIVVIIIFIVFIAGIIFDANNKMNAIKNKKKPVAEEVQSEANNQQVSPESQMSTDKQTFDTMESRAQFAAQNSMVQQPQPQPQSYSPEQDMEEIDEPQTQAPSVDSGRANTYFTFEDLNLSVKQSDIPTQLSGSDSIGNKYYYIQNRSEGDSLGMLIKVSPTRNLLWQKEIKSFFSEKPGIQSIKVTSNAVQVTMSKVQGRASVPIIFAQSGSSVSNPYPVKYFTSAGRIPSDFAVTFLSSFKHKNNDYAVISIIDVKPKNKGTLTQEEIYVYRLKNGSYNKQYKLFEIPYFIKPSNSSNLSFNIKDEGTGVLFIAMAPKTERDSAYTNAIRIPSVELVRTTPQVSGGAPSVITEGLIISNSNHSFKFEYKE